MRSEEAMDSLREVLEAVVSQILPPTEGKGGVDAGAAAFIHESLEQPFFAHLRPRIQSGLLALNNLAKRLHGERFPDCSSDQQNKILKAAHKGEIDTPDFPARIFLATMITLSLEGFLCDPQHGGNLSRHGWRHLGFVPQEAVDSCGSMDTPS